MCSITGVGERLHKVWGRLDQNSGFHGNRKPHWIIMGKTMSPPFLGCVWSDPFYTAGNENMHKISEEFEFRPVQTTDYGVSCPWASKKISHRLIMEKCCIHASLFIFDQIIIKVAGNQDRHISLDEFDFGTDQTTHFGVACPWITKILHFQNWISLRPVGQSWPNFICSITGVRERLYNVLRQIGSKLVSMATESPHWLIMGKMVSPPFLDCFWSDPFYTCR